MAQHPLNDYRVDVPTQIELIDSERRAFSPCPIVTSIFGLLCCPLFGTLSAIFAVMGYVEHRTHQYSRAAYYNKPAYAFGITAIVLGSAAILFVIILAVVMLQINGRHSGGY